MITPGTYKLGPDQGTIRLHTYREGMAKKVGHDLILEVGNWQATVEVADDLAASSLEATLDPSSITVIEGTGGVKPLSDGDRADIKKNIDDKVLKTSKFREITFSSNRVEAQGDDRVVVHGDLTIVGSTRPVTLDIALQDGPSGKTAKTATKVVQSQFGIKPFTGLMGALKVRDDVEIHVEVTVPEA